MCLGRFYFEKNLKNANPCALGVQLQFFFILAGYVLPLAFYKMPELTNRLFA